MIAAGAPGEAAAWMAQADADLSLAEELKVRRPDVACYLAQQAAEKALKAAWLCHGDRDFPYTHSLISLIRSAPKRVKAAWKVELYPDIAVLARYEELARYPSVHGKRIAAPCTTWKTSQAQNAIQTAKRLVGPCRKFLKGG